MPRKRKSKPSGILTVVVIVGAALLLLGVGNWLKSLQHRRVLAVPAASMPPGAGQAVEIQDEDRQKLEDILRQGKSP